MTKQQIAETIGNSLTPETFVNYDLGLMTKKERDLLIRSGAIITSQNLITGECSDMISNQAAYAEFYELKKQVEKDRKYARLSGLNELAAGR